MINQIGKDRITQKTFELKKKSQILSDDDKNIEEPCPYGLEQSQMSGEVIHLKTEPGEKKLDSLQIFGNAFHHRKRHPE